MFSLVAAVSLAAAQADAADGDCCLDLEARLAELEAAGAYKGNRKVTLSITGYVTKQIMFWDDGVESDAYISDIGPTQATNFRLTGEAAFAAGWKAGYMVRIQDLSDNPMGLSQTTAHVDLGLNTQMANWYVASKQLGKLSVGKNALAAKSAAMFTDLSGTQVIANYVLFDGGGFFLRDGDALLGLRWGDLGYCYSQARPWGGDCDGIVMNGVRYDGPTFSGFSVSASWGVDDDWEVAGRYAGEAGGFKISLGAGYSVNSDERTQPPPVSQSKDSAFFQAGGYVQHLATGLFLHAAYGEENNHGKQTLAGYTEPNSHQWYTKAGVRRQWFAPGHTVLFAECGQYINQLSPNALAAGLTASEFTRFGLGAVQEIDAASMSVWIRYREHSAGVTGPVDLSLTDLRYVSAGALISF